MQKQNINLISDDHDRIRALDSQHSFIVQAPAGSGKTELLIQRFLTLLQYVNHPEEILAITFTKKAANEMRTRILLALKNAATNTPCFSANAQKTQQIAQQVLLKDKALKWHLLLNPNRLHIQTIDALCVYLTKSLPLLSRFGSQPNLTDFPQQLYRETIETVLLQLEDRSSPWSAALCHLLLHVDNDMNKLHDLLFNLLAKRDQWMQYIHFNVESESIKKALEDYISEVVAERLSELCAAIPKSEIESLLALIRFAADQPSNKMSCCQHITKLPQPTVAELPQWQAIVTFLLTKQLHWRKRADKAIGFPTLASLDSSVELATHKAYRERYQALLTRLQDKTELLDRLKTVAILPNAQYSFRQWHILTALFQVLKVTAAQLRITFQQYGQIDFIENAQAALLALGSEENPTDLLLSLDYAIQHILIDEFQDTSSTQFHLLEKLVSGWETNEGRTLFVVGDPMQSIYRFREAEVGLFMRMRKAGIANIHLIPLTLTANFRSATQIVDWNNKHFQQIFPHQDDIATGAVMFNPSVAKQQMDNALVSIQGFYTTDDQKQARAIVKVILEEQKKCSANKIAILVRSRSHLDYIIPELKLANIPFHAVDIDPLGNCQAIQDLLSLTIALHHLADRIAWLSVLRAPWCGIRLNDLLLLVRNKPKALIWDCLNDENLISQLSADGQTRIKNIVPILKTQLANRERIDLRTWVETTWQLMGGPATLTQANEINDANTYFDLLTEIAEDRGIINIDILKEKVSALYASNTPHENCCLQLMTIHSAKGLEFDVVIIPHLERKLPQDDKTLLNWMEHPLSHGDQSALLIAPLPAHDDAEKDFLYEYIYRERLRKADFEADRLFYVAATRAKQALYLFYHWQTTEDGKAKIASNSFLEKLWPLISHAQRDGNETLMDNVLLEDQNKIDHTISQLEGNASSSSPHYLKRLALEWRNMTKLTPQKIFFHQQQTGFIVSDNSAQLIGVTVHQILQIIAKHGRSFWQEKNEQARERYLTQVFTQAGLATSQLTAAIDKTSQLIQNCLNDERGLWILHSHQQAQSEYRLSAVIDNEIKNLIIDRTFIDDHGIRWIIDFKTSALTHNDVEIFLTTEYEKYQNQMQDYARAIQLIEPDRPLRLGLYFPAIPAWKEWDYI